MNRFVCLLFATGMLLAGGCAGTPPAPDPEREAAATNPALEALKGTRYQRFVENRARRDGVEVYWLNPPREVTEAEDDEETERAEILRLRREREEDEDDGAGR